MSMLEKNEFVLWLRRYNWDWFCTLTFRPGIRRKASEQLFHSWIAALEAYEGKNLSWVRTAEYGGVGGKLHFHVLIAGLKRFPMQKATEHWFKLAGSAVIGPYNPQQRGLQYMLKTIEDDPDYDFDAALLGEHLRRQTPRLQPR